MFVHTIIWFAWLALNNHNQTMMDCCPHSHAQSAHIFGHRQLSLTAHMMVKYSGVLHISIWTIPFLLPPLLFPRLLGVLIGSFIEKERPIFCWQSLSLQIHLVLPATRSGYFNVPWLYVAQFDQSRNVDHVFIYNASVPILWADNWYIHLPRCFHWESPL